VRPIPHDVLDQLDLDLITAEEDAVDTLSPEL
jgi:hypothetical protein